MDSEINPSPAKEAPDAPCTAKEATEMDRQEPAATVSSGTIAATVSSGTIDQNVVTTSSSASSKSSAPGANKSWDHSDRKVLMLNIPKYINAGEVQKMLRKWLVDRSDLMESIQSMKKPTDKYFAVVKLKSADMVQPFIDYLHDIKATNKKGERIKCDRVKSYGRAGDNGDELDRRDKRKPDEDLSRQNKRQRSQPRRQPLTEKEVKNVITPLWEIPYQRQLTKKMRQIGAKCCRKLIKDVQQRFRELNKEARRNPKHRSILKPYEWMETPNGIGKHAIPMDRIVASPLEVEYRNKCELTFGYENSFEGPATPNSNGAIAGASAGANTDETVAETKGGSQTTSSSDAARTPVQSTTLSVQSAPQREQSTTSSDASERSVQKAPAAGFMAGGWSGGVNHPKVARNVPWEVCALADLFNNFLQDFSELPPYASSTHKGIWRQVTIRSSKRTKECMVVICHSPATGGVGNAESSTGYSSERLSLEKEELVRRLTAKELVIPDYYAKAMKGGETQATNPDAAASSAAVTMPEAQVTNPDAAAASGAVTVPGTLARTMTSLTVTSVFFQEYDGLSNPKPSDPVEHAYGKKFLEEQLLHCTFQISPGAFFQVNTEGAELLYSIVVEKIRETCPDPTKTILMDVCCGTGTIGLTCLKEGVVGRIVGVDISEPAIADAKRNAERNGYKDANITKFVASKAEEVMDAELKQLRNKYSDFKIVAVVDPARDGLHMDVVKALRATERIDRLIYVSCNPTGSFVRDATILCTPPSKKLRGEPFYPSRVRPVDMFPWTDHCELVAVFDRLSKWKPPTMPAEGDSKKASSEEVKTSNEIMSAKAPAEVEVASSTEKPAVPETKGETTLSEKPVEETKSENEPVNAVTAMDAEKFP